MRYLPLTPSERAEMLSVIGADSVDALFSDVPAEARLAIKTLCNLWRYRGALALPTASPAF